MKKLMTLVFAGLVALSLSLPAMAQATKTTDTKAQTAAKKDAKDTKKEADKKKKADKKAADKKAKDDKKAPAAAASTKKK
jgi:hypothetical protein